ncbi:Uncharacterized protein BP5553_08128 [Venustampulla echinocandica]|uniref:Uncharacterized protein n=1 Tax=Venustampulla echinocandica TaxID=2656787 RepID=A0A370TFT1_9HELO|nr:Uncharacterized protein BP5553_08128 [Venustampulla echinocandica]RDL33760.1 Uncharacterized protein BP5553_08128 [Venustampulla echinocandica]
MLQLNIVNALCLQILFSSIASAGPLDTAPKYQALPPLREQAVIQDALRDQRVSNIPHILQKYGVDAWLMSQKEYAEDTVFWSLKSATQFSARRRTVQLFLANATAGVKSAYTWIDNTPKVWSDILEVLEEQNPASIALNIDTDISFSSGLHAGEYETIIGELGEKWSKKVVSEPMVAVEYIGTMVKERLPWYRKLQETAWAIISEGFSEKVITPGKTTTEDVEWWMREKIQQLNYTTWFMPSVNILDDKDIFGSGTEIKSGAIQYGDVLHVDFGVTALGLNTDTQHLAYVLHPGETESDIPQGLLNGLKTANRLQDIVKSNMKIGSSGNTILKNALKQMHSEGIEGKIYSHPIGDWGHSAGTLIGMSNQQDEVPVLGDLPLLDNTYYSVELYATHFVPERNATMYFYLEEDIYWVDEGKRWDWVYGQQKKFHLVRPQGAKAGELFRVQSP